MYLTGEHNGFDSIATTPCAWVSGVGAGGMALTGVDGSGNQTFTAAAIAAGLNSNPNAIASVAFNAAQTVTAASVSQGFLATVHAGQSPTAGSCWVGLDDITGAAGAKMLIGMDIEIFANARTGPRHESVPGRCRLRGS